MVVRRYAINLKLKVLQWMKCRYEGLTHRLFIGLQDFLPRNGSSKCCIDVVVLNQGFNRYATMHLSVFPGLNSLENGLWNIALSIRRRANMRNIARPENCPSLPHPREALSDYLRKVTPRKIVG